MARKNDNYRSRTHMLLLYPDCAEHMQALEHIKSGYEYACIKHDKDFWTEEDEKENPDHVSGEVKKSHYHVIIRFPNPTWRTAVCKELNLTENYCEQVKNLDNALLYLIHFNEIDKYQYPMEEVSGSLKKRLKMKMQDASKTEGEKVCELITFIKQEQGYISTTKFAEFCAINGYWAEYRRAGAIFNRIIEEHNEMYKIKKENNENQDGKAV